MCCVGSLDKKEAFPKSLKREVNIAFDNHFEVTLGGILVAKGAPGAAKVASEAAKWSQGTARGDLDSPPEVSGTLSGHLGRFCRGGGT